MSDGNLGQFTFSSAKQTIKQIRYRYFTEAELYRPFSQLYDDVEYLVSSKKLRSWGWALFSNGITHLISACAGTLDGKPLWIVPDIGRFYRFVSAAVFGVGLLLLIVSHPKRRKPSDKESLINKYLDQEYADDGSSSGTRPQFADSLKDSRLVLDDLIVVGEHDKHQSENHRKQRKTAHKH